MSRRAPTMLMLVPVGAMVLAGCAFTVNPGQSAAGTAHAGLAVGDARSPMPTAGLCRIGSSSSGQPLPDPACTPGAVNPDVRSDTLQQTICRHGWTATVRPPSSVTDRMKQASARSYGLPAGESGEYDHLVPLELGGAPADPRNLWIEPGALPNAKDTVERELNHAVCAGTVPLSVAQRAIATNWTTALDAVGLSGGGQW